MPGTSIAFGIILILVGIAGYAYGISAGNASVTALIPAFFGLALAACGVIARLSEDIRKHLMHLAVVVALIGFILTAGRLLMKLSEFSLSPAVLSQAAMAVVCLIYVILSIRSFAQARSERRV